MAKHRAGGGGSRALDIILTLALLAGAGFGCYYVASKSVTIDQTTTYYTPSTEPTEPEPDPNAIQYDSVEVANSAVNEGPLILVNNSTACVPVTEDQLVSLYLKKLEAESEAFSVRDAELYVTGEFADAIIAMLNDFNAATGDDNILVLSGYRSQELQQKLYDEDLAATGNETSERVAMPGYSEHQTGLGIDLTISGENEYDGTGIYSWIDEHCAEYGIVLRYPEDKQAITDIQYEPWHYRYVGKPHASFMMQQGLVLEEYLQMLKSNYTYEGEHLRISDTDEKIYEIYYYAMDSEYESTMVAVPKDKDYTICGNNTDGFIVTVDTGETGTVTPEPAEGDAPAEEVPAENDVDAEGENSPEETANAEEN